MGVHVVQLADLGEGIVEAEIVEWLVEVGDAVTTETALVAMMTDKASVDVSSPVDGVVSWLGGEAGDIVSVGANLVGIDIEGEPEGAATRTSYEPTNNAVDEAGHLDTDETNRDAGQPLPSAAVSRPLAQPSVRKRARELALDLGSVRGTARGGRITHDDLERHLAGQNRRLLRSPDTSVSTHPVRGVRRAMATKMSTAWEHIPHITYIEEVDVTQLELLRSKLNERRTQVVPRLTMLPFITRALSLACAEHPHMNATFDDLEGIVEHSVGVHVGIATQTSTGLVVPVVRHAETMGLWGLATEITSLAERARRGDLGRQELSGSTITISSLGGLGGLATTPIINYPEVAVVGVNKMQIRPIWQEGAFMPRRMINLSSSFDHRVIDGWEAATFIQMVKSLLETPAMIFMDNEQ